jgi:hypothetical protein
MALEDHRRFLDRQLPPREERAAEAVDHASRAALLLDRIIPEAPEELLQRAPAQALLATLADRGPGPPSAGWSAVPRQPPGRGNEGPEFGRRAGLSQWRVPGSRNRPGTAPNATGVPGPSSRPGFPGRSSRSLNMDLAH